MHAVSPRNCSEAVLLMSSDPVSEHQCCGVTLDPCYSKPLRRRLLSGVQPNPPVLQPRGLLVAPAVCESLSEWMTACLGSPDCESWAWPRRRCACAPETAFLLPC